MNSQSKGILKRSFTLQTNKTKIVMFNRVSSRYNNNYRISISSTNNYYKCIMKPLAIKQVRIVYKMIYNFTTNKSMLAFDCALFLLKALICYNIIKIKCFYIHFILSILFQFTFYNCIVDLHFQFMCMACDLIGHLLINYASQPNKLSQIYSTDRKFSDNFRKSQEIFRKLTLKYLFS